MDFSEDCFSLPPSGQIDHHTARAMHNAMGVQGADGSVIINGVASGWWPVTRGLPQASVLGPLLFNVVLTDLHVGLEDILSLFVDDTKLGGAADSIEGREALQKDVEKVESWEITNDMRFSKSKCQIPHLAKDKPGCMDCLVDEAGKQPHRKRFGGFG